MSQCVQDVFYVMSILSSVCGLRKALRMLVSPPLVILVCIGTLINQLKYQLRDKNSEILYREESDVH